MRFKILFSLIGIVAGARIPAQSQGYNDLKQDADSLFAIQKYTQSYNYYDSIYNIGKLSSPQMLLKMAYIKEGLGDYTLALFHLNEYYIQTSDERALEKMASLGGEHNLIGYDYSESDFIVSVYHEYYNQLIIALVLFSIIFLVGLVYQKYRLKQRPITNFILTSISILTLAIVINTGMGYREAIVTHPNTYIMSSPSSSSEVLAIISKGNKVPIKKSQDVWLRTEWGDQIAYIKSKNVTPVTSW